MDVGQLLKEYQIIILLIAWSTKELWPWAKSRLDLAANRSDNRAKTSLNRVKTIESLYERLLTQNERQMKQNGRVSDVIEANTLAYSQVELAISDNTHAIVEMRQMVQNLESTVEHFRNTPV